MKKAFDNILATVIAAGILANFAVLWSFSDRLARIETKLELRQTVVAKNEK